jgi:hypothetical protein
MLLELWAFLRDSVFIYFIFTLVFNFHPFLEHLHNLHTANYTGYTETSLIVARRVYIACFQTILFERPWSDTDMTFIDGNSNISLNIFIYGPNLTIFCM